MMIQNISREREARCTKYSAFTQDPGKGRTPRGCDICSLTRRKHQWNHPWLVENLVEMEKFERAFFRSLYQSIVGQQKMIWLLIFNLDDIRSSC